MLCRHIMQRFAGPNPQALFLLSGIFPSKSTSHSARNVQYSFFQKTENSELIHI